MPLLRSKFSAPALSLAHKSNPHPNDEKNAIPSRPQLRRVRSFTDINHAIVFTIQERMAAKLKKENVLKHSSIVKYPDSPIVQYEIEDEKSFCAETAFDLLISHHIHGIPVYDKSKHKYIGSVELAHIAKNLLKYMSKEEKISVEKWREHLKKEEISEEILNHVTTSVPVLTVKDSDSLYEVIQHLRSPFVRRVIILNSKTNHGIGVISETDMLEYFRAHITNFTLKDGCEVPLTAPEVSDFQQAKKFTFLKTSNSFAEALKMLLEYDVFSIPVLNERGDLINTFSLSDIKSFFCNPNAHCWNENLKSFLENHCNKKCQDHHDQVVTASVGLPITTMIEIMFMNHCHHLFILDHIGGLPVGEMSISDVCDFITTNTFPKSLRHKLSNVNENKEMIAPIGTTFGASPKFNPNAVAPNSAISSPPPMSPKLTHVSSFTNMNADKTADNDRKYDHDEERRALTPLHSASRPKSSPIDNEYKTANEELSPLQQQHQQLEEDNATPPSRYKKQDDFHLSYVDEELPIGSTKDIKNENDKKEADNNDNNNNEKEEKNNNNNNNNNDNDEDDFVIHEEPVNDENEIMEDLDKDEDMYSTFNNNKSLDEILKEERLKSPNKEPFTLHNGQLFQPYQRNLRWLKNRNVQNKIQLISYPDSFGKDLKGLQYVVDTYLKDVIGGIHILPFYPSSADRGFAPLTYKKVDPSFGTWDDIEPLAKNYDIVCDFMVNHISQQSEEFQDFKKKRDESLYCNLFIRFKDFWKERGGEPLKEDLDKIYTRKPRPPYFEVIFDDGKEPKSEKVWCTFDYEQIDIDVSNKSGQKFIQDQLTSLCSRGVKFIRLDAFGYSTKKIGTRCFMQEPEVWDILQWISNICKQYNVQLLAEIHEHYTIQLGLAAKTDQSYWVYDFALPMLLLQALYDSSIHNLLNWLCICPHNQLTTLDTHDGIGVVDVRDLMTQKESDATSENLYRYGANVKRVYSSANYLNLDIYQINCTYYSALGNRENWYLLARAVQVFCPGIPQIYYVGLFAGENDIELVEKTQVGRDINRHNYTLDEIKKEVQRSIVQRLFALCKFRNSYPAFNGDFHVDAFDQNHPYLLNMSWKYEPQYYTVLHANFKDKTFEINYFDSQQKRMTLLNLDW